MIDTSTIISIVYFSANILLLIILALYVQRTSEHLSIKSKAFIKYVWGLRKIFGPIIVYFYDTATDFGVVYYWYTLMKHEQQYGASYYETVDMEIFFWCGIAFLLFYRFVALLFAVSELGGCSHIMVDVVWYDMIFVVLDVYVFKTIYQSFKQAQANDADKDIEIHENQLLLQTCEACAESMPQIILQSVFLLRSANEENIEQTDIILVLFSIIASLISISTKFVTIDGKIIIADSAEHLHPQQSFPDCVNYFYVTRAAWRVFNIMTRFAIMVLMWAVLGGAWLAIWCVINWIPLVVMFKIYSRSQSVIVELGGKALVSLIGTIPYGFDQTRAIYNLIIVGYAQNIVSLAVIAVFGTVEFDCFVDICADSSMRQFVNEQGNNRMLIFFCMGSIALIFDVILFVMLRRNDLIVIG
eukprot:97872_1